MDTFHKQFLIHSLQLPYELCDEINSYVFYDKDTVEVRNRFRKTCVEEINYSYSNRKYGGGTSIVVANKTGTIGFRGETEDWSFFSNIYEDRCFELCAINCKLCGNYLMSNSRITNHNRTLMCSCNRDVSEFYLLLSDWTINFTSDMWNNAHPTLH